MYIIKVGPDAYIYNFDGVFYNIINKTKIQKFINDGDKILIFDSFEQAEEFVQFELVGAKFNCEIVRIDSSIKIEFKYSELLLINKLLDSFRKSDFIKNIKKSIEKVIDSKYIGKIDEIHVLDAEDKIKEMFD